MKTEDLLIGALLRVPAQAIQRRLIKGLNAAGFDELRLPHMAVLQFPGPNGVRPGVLAERAGVSKQAINQLLRSLEASGYVARSDAPDRRSGRVILSTERGHAAFWKMVDILRDIEREWIIELGPERFAELKGLLFLVWDSPLVRPPDGLPTNPGAFGGLGARHPYLVAAGDQSGYEAPDSAFRIPMPSSPDDLLAYLAALGIEATTVDHPPLHTVEDSRALRGHIPGGHTKNLFVKDKKGRLFLLVLGETTTIDLKRVHEKIGAQGRVSFGSGELLEEVWGVRPGAVTPFGAINDATGRVRVVLDEAMMRQERLNFHPLVNSRTTGLASADLVNFLRATGHEPLIVALGEDGTAH
jgi:Ala-tRNA(Pro) deacylase